MNTDVISRDLDSIEKLGVPYFEVRVRKNHGLVYSASRGDGGAGKRFFLYSCSKVMTVSAAMRLIEQDKLSLEDPVRKYLPAFENAFLETDGVKRPPACEMKIKHLLTMSAGLNYNLNTLPLKRAAAVPGADTSFIVSALAEAPLGFDPGEKFEYSLCHDVLGAVIEQASGLGFDRYMSENVFEPLGMKRTSFRCTEAELAPKYVYKNGIYTSDSLTNIYALTPGYISGGAGVVSDCEDLSLFADALSCGGEAATGYKLLAPQTVELIRTEQASKLLVNNNFSCAAGEEFSYAYGVHTLTKKLPSTRAPYGVFGWDGAAGSYIMCDPDNRVSIAFVTHVHGWTGIRPWFHRPLRNAVYEALGF